MATDPSKQVISFSDKNALLAQIRQNLAAGKGPSGSAKQGGQPGSSLLAGSLGLPLPNSNSSSHPHLNQFAKQLAALAQKSTTDSMLDLIGGASQSELDNNSSSSNSGSSPMRPSSLLDPKARALPSASLHKKVATVSPNVSKARIFTPNRPLAAVEPMMKTPNTAADEKTPTSESPILASMCSAPSSLSALSALSASPMSAASGSLSRFSEMPSELMDFANNSSGGGRSGLFDNLSLASQLEGFASSTSKAVAPPAESLKDLLKATPSAAGNGLPAPPPFQWNGNGGIGNPMHGAFPWSDYAQWNTSSSWNGPPVAGHDNSPAWSSSSQWSSTPRQQQQQQVNGSDFASSSTGNGAKPATTSAATDSYGNQQYSNFGNPWPPGSFVTNTTAASSSSDAAAPYPSHSQSDGQYPGPPPYFPTNSYLNTANYANYYPQGNQPSFPTGTSNYHLNQYHSAHGGGTNFTPTPGYPQPYPGSFSQ